MLLLGAKVASCTNHLELVSNCQHYIKLDQKWVSVVLYNFNKVPTDSTEMIPKRPEKWIEQAVSIKFWSSPDAKIFCG
jgi:hypothetical protein